jgi:hypothetical protein
MNWFFGKIANQKYKIYRLIKIVIKTMYRICRYSYRKIIGSLLTKHIQLDTRELFYQENRNGFNRYDIIIRYLAIENYYEKNNFGFKLYEKMQDARGNKKGYGIESLVRFKELVKSYERSGYKKTSEIELNKDLCLHDGSHRMALALYNKLEKISCKIRPYSIPVEYGIDWFLENDFTSNEISMMQSKYMELKNQLMVPFILILWPDVQKYFDEILKKIAFLEDVSFYKDYLYDDLSFEKIVKHIYAADSIAEWKIDKKLEYMKHNEQKIIRLIFLQIETPNFRIRENGSQTISVRGEAIKRIIRNAYKNKIENYYDDIIIHSGDNYYQNSFILNLFNLDIKKPNA